MDKLTARDTARKISSSVKEYQSQEQRRTTQVIQRDDRRASRVQKRF